MDPTTLVAVACSTVAALVGAIVLSRRTGEGKAAAADLKTGASDGPAAPASATEKGEVRDVLHGGLIPDTAKLHGYQFTAAQTPGLRREA